MTTKKTIIIILVLVALIGLGIWVFQKRVEAPAGQNGQWKEEQTQNTSYKEIASVQDLIDGEYQFENVDTSKWQTYRNEEMGFEMKIPEGWECGSTRKINDRIFTGCIDKKQMDIEIKRNETEKNVDFVHDTVVIGYSENENKDLRSLVLENISDKNKSKEKVYSMILNKKNWILVKGESRITTYYHGEHGWSISYLGNTFSTDNKYKQFLDGMLQTIKLDE